MTIPSGTELLELARLADQDRPYVKEQLARLKAAAAEESPAGALRQSIHRHRIPLSILERDSGLSIHEINAFLEGGELSMSAFWRLAQAAGMRVEVVEAVTFSP